MSAFLTNLDLTKIKQRPARNAESRFPCKLYRLLIDVEEKGLSHIISWHPDGTCFRVHDPETFAREIMPVYFKPGKYRSFQRQLNLYGFQRFTALKPFWESCYRHPAFTQSQKLGCTKIDRPIRQKKTPSTTAAAAAAAPAFVTSGSSSNSSTMQNTDGNNINNNNNNVNMSYTQSNQMQPMALPAGNNNNTNNVTNDELLALSSSLLASPLILPGNEENNKWSKQDEDWFEKNSANAVAAAAEAAQRQRNADEAAAQWRRVGETFQAYMMSTNSNNNMNMNDLDQQQFEPKPFPEGHQHEQHLQQQQQQQQQQNLFKSQTPPSPSQPNTYPTSNNSNSNNLTTTEIDEAALTEPVWLTEDINLCQEIMGKDCDLCTDGNKLIDDFLSQRNQ